MDEFSASADRLVRTTPELSAKEKDTFVAHLTNQKLLDAAEEIADRIDLTSSAEQAVSQFNTQNPTNKSAIEVGYFRPRGSEGSQPYYYVTVWNNIRHPENIQPGMQGGNIPEFANPARIVYVGGGHYRIESLTYMTKEDTGRKEYSWVLARGDDERHSLPERLINAVKQSATIGYSPRGRVIGGSVAKK